jgi:hypothetical protein
MAECENLRPECEVRSKKVKAETIEASAAIMALKAGNGIRYVQRHQSGPSFQKGQVIAACPRC